jgi:hypothetical protein
LNERIADMSMGQVLGILAAVGLLSVAVFYIMLFIFAKLTGWNDMARRYRDVALEATPFRAGSAVLGRHAWSSPPLFIGVDDNGITLRPAFPFWPVFARMHVPWDAVVRIERKERMFFDVLELHCGREQESIVGILPSGAANAIAARWPVKVVPAS